MQRPPKPVVVLYNQTKKPDEFTALNRLCEKIPNKQNALHSTQVQLTT